MRILSIETSCDETAVSIVEANGSFPSASYQVLGNALFSQIDIHREYGGVFPMMAKREHAISLVPMLEKAWHASELKETTNTPALHPETEEAIKKLLERENDLADNLLTFHKTHGKLPIDLISVTSGPGLTPALWVGINFAKALALLWDIRIVPAHHMEGHILASIFDGEKLAKLAFPALALLVSGGHTELVLMKKWGHYERIGNTRDDAVGEAFDKVARLLDLPYPGGPELDRLTSYAIEQNLTSNIDLPRPMLHSDDFDFSFSGLKTAVRYAVAEKELTPDDKAGIAREFQNAVTEVLLKKTEKAVEHFSAQSIILGGGVSANQHLRDAFSGIADKPDFKGLDVYLPPRELSTDNSIMIALAGHAHTDKVLRPDTAVEQIVAQGRQSLSDLHL